MASSSEITEVIESPEITEVIEEVHGEIELMPVVRSSIAPRHHVIQDGGSPQPNMSRYFKGCVILFLLTILVSSYVFIGCVRITDNQPILTSIDVTDVKLELDISNHTLLVGETATLDAQFSKPTKMVGYPDLRVRLGLGYNLHDGYNGSQSFTISSKDKYVFPIVNDSVILRFNRLEIELEDEQFSALRRRFEDGGKYWIGIQGDFRVGVRMKTLWFLHLHKHILFHCKIMFTGRPPVLVMAGKKCMIH